MRIHVNRRLGLSTIMTAMIMLTAVAILGTVALVLSTQNFTLFKTILDETLTNTAAMNKNQESLVIENSVYHSSTQQFNFTFTNYGNLAINITKIQINSPTLSVIAIPSASVSNTAHTSVISSNSKSINYTIPGTIIFPGKTYTSAIPYNCLINPVSVSATTSRGTVINSQVAPNVGWYNNQWQNRKAITIDYTKVVGNPQSVQLDNLNTTSGITSLSNKITLSGFVVGTGNNRILLVAVQSSAGPVNSITYGGINIPNTNVIKKINTVDSEVWWLLAPKSGKADIVVTMSGSASVIVGAYSLFGVDQTTPILKTGSASGTGTSNPSNNLVTNNQGSWAIDSIANLGVALSSPSQTQEWINNVGGAVYGGSSLKIMPNPGTVTFSWTAASSTWSWVSLEVKASSLNNLPVLVSTIDTDLKNNALANGTDILFTSCDGKTKLNHEIENYTSLTGSLTAWVQHPNLYPIPNNVIYMYYGHSAGGNQQSVANTWNSNYGGVWHVENCTSASNTAKFIRSQSSSGSNAGTITVSNFNVDSGTCRLLLVAVESKDTSSTTSIVNSITFGGQPLTRQVSVFRQTYGGEIWYLVDPPSGSNNIVATMSSASYNAVVGAYYFTGVDDKNPLPTSASTVWVLQNSGKLPITTQYSNSIVVDSLAIENQVTMTPNATQTQQWNVQFSGDLTGGSSTYPVSSPTATNVGWAWPGNPYDGAYVAVEVKSKDVLSGMTADSTNNVNHFTTNVLDNTNKVQGQFASGLYFSSANSYYLSRQGSLTGLPSTPSVPQTSSIWMRISAAPSGTQDIYTLQTAGGGGASAVKMGFKTATTVDVWSYGGSTMVTNPIPSTNTWHYLTYSYDGNAANTPEQNQTHRLYIDGVQVTKSTTTPEAGSLTQLYVGTYNTGGGPASEFYKGKLDELRYSTVVRSASWIATEYNNQASPSTFYTIGPIEKVTDMRSSQ